MRKLKPKASRERAGSMWRAIKMAILFFKTIHSTLSMLTLVITMPYYCTQNIRECEHTYALKAVPCFS